jgi:hypothetical protein
MKNMVKIAVAVIAAQACLASAVSAGPAAQPVVVDMAVNVVVDAPSGELSDAAEAISAASASGNNYKAQELLSELFSGGVKAEKAEPVLANKCCCVHHSTAAPAATELVAVSTAAAAAPVAALAAAPGVPAALTPDELAAEFAAAKAKKAAAAKEAAKKEKEEEQKLKGFAWGVTIMTVALIILIILL